MRSLAKVLIPDAMIVGALIGAAATAPAMDGSQVIQDRAAVMKQQAKDLGIVKAFFTGKGDQAAAETAAADLTHTTRKIPNLFPPGSDAESPGGKFAPKPEIWSQWDKFLAAQKNAAAKADALLALVKSGGKAEIQAAFADFGKNGCGGCHEHFRTKLKD
jgi:cytochrome c556